MSKRVGIALLALTLASCGSDPMMPPDKGARIISFRAEPTTVKSGGTTVLSWEVVGTNSVVIEPSVGLQPPTGSAEVRPFATTTYTLSVRSGDQDLTSQVTVEVEGGPPRVAAFTAKPLTIQLGETSTLEWTTSNVNEVIIQPDIGTKGPSGTVDVMPEVTTTYELTAVGDNGSVTSNVTVVVASGNQPFIRDFSASAMTIDAGEPVTLSWETLNTDSVTIDNGVGSQAANGSVQVMPNQTTIYNLTAVGPGGTANASIEIVVEATGTPEILSFTSMPTMILPGGTATLEWETDNAVSVEIDNGVGPQRAKGSVDVSPTQTTTYVLTAFGQNEMVSEMVTVTVLDPNAPIVDTFEAQPLAIQIGGSTTLTWTTQNANSVDIDNGVGTGLPANGSIQVSPTQTTTYRITARGANGDATAEITVAVTAAPPSVTRFNAQPASVNVGQSTTLTWETLASTSVEIDNGVGMGLPANGSAQVSPTQTTTYELRATGPGGEVTAQVTVTVTQVGAPTVSSFDASPLTVTAGSPSTLSWTTQDATSVSIDNGLGAQALNGSVQVTPSQTTTYTLTAIGSGGQTTAQVTVNVSSPNGDQCSNPFDITQSGSFTGNSQTAVNDYSDTTGCTGFASNGPDVAYRVSLQAGDRLRATLAPVGQSWDASIYLVSSCGDVSQSCVAGQDNGNPEEIDYTAPTAGDYFLIVDGYSASAGGPYQLDVTLNPVPVPNDQCAGAIDATGGGVFNGDTRNATDDYNPGAGGCTGYPATGRDVVYSIDVAAGERVQASLSAAWDASLYLTTACTSIPGSCVAGQDNGNPEEIDYTAQTAGTLLLFVDGYGGASGNFGLTISVSPPAVGGETCQNAVSIPAGGGSFQATTAGAIDDYDPPTMCTGAANPGPDRVYSVDLAAGDVVEVLAEFDAAVDGSVYVATDCAALSSCISGADNVAAGEAEELRFVAQTAGAHYVIVDASSANSSGPHDLTVATYGGDVCADAPPLLLTNAPEWFTTTGLSNDYSPNSGGCTGYSASGEDRAYGVNLQAGDQLQVTIDATSAWDPALYMVSNCADIGGSCVQGSDAVAPGGSESLSAVVQQAGLYHVIVDGFLGGDGPGTINARVARGDTCADAYRVPDGGGTFEGTTTGYSADYGATSLGSCTTFAQIGADAVYAIELEANERVTAELTTSWDSALYLISDCAQSASTCVDGEDNGGVEDIDFTAQTAGTYFLVVDSWRVGASYEGNYSLTIAYP